MSLFRRRLRAVYPLLVLVAIVSPMGCAHTPPVAGSAEVHTLQVALTSLSPTVQEDEAARVASVAYHYSRDLGLKYQAVRPALLHNFLVNGGFKQRGLCYEWAEDLLAQLKTFNLESLDLHWGIARWDTLREHNTVVITAHGQPFEHGIVLDPWRRSGWLVWSPVLADRYPWVEGELTNSPVAVMRK